MKAFDITAAVLLVVGGLNWGLVGLFGFDLVAALFGTMSPLSRLVYVLVGTAAVYQAAMLPLIQRRWGVAPARA
jgi:hypothetical protein